MERLVVGTVVDPVRVLLEHVPSMQVVGARDERHPVSGEVARFLEQGKRVERNKALLKDVLGN